MCPASHCRIVCRLVCCLFYFKLYVTSLDLIFLVSHNSNIQVRILLDNSVLLLELWYKNAIFHSGRLIESADYTLAVIANTDEVAAQFHVVFQRLFFEFDMNIHDGNLLQRTYKWKLHLISFDK